MKLEIKINDIKESEPETQRALKLWVVLARSFHAVGEHAGRSIRGFGLNPTEFGVLEALYHRGPLLLGEVGRRILLTSGSVTYVIDKLEKQGLLRRVACPQDRRAIYAELTEAGRARMEEIFPAHAEAIREALAGLDAAEQEAAIGLLRRLGKGARDRLPAVDRRGRPEGESERKGGEDETASFDDE